MNDLITTLYNDIRTLTRNGYTCSQIYQLYFNSKPIEKDRYNGIPMHQITNIIFDVRNEYRTLFPDRN